MATISRTYALTHQRLLEVLDYNPDSGEWRWRVDVKSHGGGRKAGDLAGCFDGHYLRMRIDGGNYLGHRLAVFYMTGRWPKDVDHANRNPQDNRWSNLREATVSQNLANAKRRADNTSGFKGVHWDRVCRCWRAQLWVNGKKRNVWRGDDPAEGHAAYVAAAKKAFGEYAHPG